MIPEDQFLDKLRWLCEVTGSRITRERGKYLWDELRGCEMEDFELAVRDVAYADEKINLATLSRLINGYASERIEREARERRAEEEQAHRKWWREHMASRHECVNDGDCRGCLRKYCDLISKDCSNMIKKLFDGEIDADTMHGILAEKYRGIGFETLTKEEPF